MNTTLKKIMYVVINLVTLPIVVLSIGLMIPIMLIADDDLYDEFYLWELVISSKNQVIDWCKR